MGYHLKDVYKRQVQWDLSPEAQRTYATLLLDQSIRGDDKEGVLEAVKLLLTLENRPQPFIDAAAWLMLNRETSEARSPVSYTHLLACNMVPMPPSSSRVRPEASALRKSATRFSFMVSCPFTGGQVLNGS